MSILMGIEYYFRRERIVFLDRFYVFSRFNRRLWSHDMVVPKLLKEVNQIPECETFKSVTYLWNHAQSERDDFWRLLPYWVNCWREKSFLIRHQSWSKNFLNTFLGNCKDVIVFSIFCKHLNIFRWQYPFLHLVFSSWEFLLSFRVYLLTGFLAPGGTPLQVLINHSF